MEGVSLKPRITSDAEARIRICSKVAGVRLLYDTHQPADWQSAIGNWQSSIGSCASQNMSQPHAVKVRSAHPSACGQLIGCQQEHLLCHQHGTHQLWFHGEAKVKEVKVEDVSDVDGDLEAVGEQMMR